MKKTTNQLPKKQARNLYRFKPATGLMDTTVTSSRDPTTTTSTVTTSTHIFGL